MQKIRQMYLGRGRELFVSHCVASLRYLLWGTPIEDKRCAGALGLAIGPIYIPRKKAPLQQCTGRRWARPQRKAAEKVRGSSRGGEYILKTKQQVRGAIGDTGTRLKPDKKARRRRGNEELPSPSATPICPVGGFFLQAVYMYFRHSDFRREM